MARLCYIMAVVFKLLFTAMLVHRAGATEFKVGGSIGWTVPADPNSTVYDQWAERNRFQIGDSLLFVYEHDKDSVLWVNKEEHDQCNTQSFTASFNDGKTLFKFNHSGPYYFISGTDGNCLKNEKMAVVVMADRSHKSTPNNTSPAPAPSPIHSSSSVNPPATAPPPAVATNPPENPPAMATPPSPVVANSPEPPPATAPVGQSTPSNNGVSSMMMQLTTSFGFLFLGSHLLFALLRAPICIFQSIMDFLRRAFRLRPIYAFNLIIPRWN